MTQTVRDTDMNSNGGTTPQCETHCQTHLDRLGQMRSKMLPIDRAQQMAEFLGTLADPTRLRLLSVLATQDLCVCDLAALLEMTESAVSHQLRLLRSQRFVKYRKVGRNVYYSLADSHIINLYREVAEHLEETHY